MFSRSLLSKETYKQDGEFCVLGSYAVAMKPFLNGTKQFDVQDFFKAYCDEMGCLCSSPKLTGAIGWERLYLSDFALRTSTMSGYNLIRALHENSTVSPFKEAGSKLAVQPCSLDQNGFPTIETALKNAAKRVVALACVNKVKIIPQTPSFACVMPPHHSVVVGFEGTFFAYDVNHGQQLIELGNTIQALATADCLLFTEN